MSLIYGSFHANKMSLLYGSFHTKWINGPSWTTSDFDKTCWGGVF